MALFLIIALTMIGVVIWGALPDPDDAADDETTDSEWLWPREKLPR